MIRRAEPSQVTLFFVSSSDKKLDLVCPCLEPFTLSSQILPIGTHCFCHIYFIQSDNEHSFPTDLLIEYELWCDSEQVDLSAYCLGDSAPLTAGDSPAPSHRLVCFLKDVAPLPV